MALLWGGGLSRAESRGSLGGKTERSLERHGDGPADLGVRVAEEPHERGEIPVRETARVGSGREGGG